MDIFEKDVAMLQEKGFDITCNTEYVVQVKFPLGDWYAVSVRRSLAAAIEDKEQEIDRWFKDWDTEQDSYPVRIVMRRTVEVIL